MKTIWKYPLLPGRTTVWNMPIGARTLFFAMQNGLPTLWALVDPLAERHSCAVYVIGTGHPVPDETRYVGSVLDGEFVWHCFIPERTQ